MTKYFKPKKLLAMLAFIEVSFLPAYADVQADPLLRKNGCYACHDANKNIVGPAFKDVVAYYKGKSNAEESMFNKIKNGSSGVWGPLPMPPSANMDDQTIRTMAQTILGVDGSNPSSSATAAENTNKSRADDLFSSALAKNDNELKAEIQTQSANASKTESTTNRGSSVGLAILAGLAEGYVASLENRQRTKQYSPSSSDESFTAYDSSSDYASTQPSYGKSGDRAPNSNRSSSNVNASRSNSSDNPDKNATQCLKITQTKEGLNAITNACSSKVAMVFCGTDAGVHEIIGVCGKDIGGSHVDPGEISQLTQGRSRVQYYFIGCFWPYIPWETKWTGRGLYANGCVHQ